MQGQESAAVALTEKSGSTMQTPPCQIPTYPRTHCIARDERRILEGSCALSLCVRVLLEAGDPSAWPWWTVPLVTAAVAGLACQVFVCRM
jgi:hypothetical protein